MPFKRVKAEDQFYMQLDDNRLREMREEQDRKRQKEAKDKRKEAHYLKCPKCGFDLKEIEYGNVLIDVCDDCRGIWLDAGELEILVQGQAKLNQNFLGRLFRKSDKK